MKYALSSVAAASALILAFGHSADGQSSIVSDALDVDADAKSAEARGAQELGWEDLLPEGEEERLMALYQSQWETLYSTPIAEGSAGDQAVQIGTYNVVDTLDGVKVRLPGYTVPFEFGANAEITDFLLVPYFGACLHQPPPPPNQTVYVTTDSPVKLKDLAQAVWVEGVLSTDSQETELAGAAYTITLTKLTEYEY